MKPCELWTDEALNRFLEDNKGEVGGLTTYPSEEWGERLKRKLKALQGN